MRVSFARFLAASAAAAVAATAALALGAGPAPTGSVDREVGAADPGLARDGALLLLDGEPWTGRVVERDAEGRTLSIAAYVDGLRNGVDRGWWPDGAPRWERAYEEGLETGVHRGWWPDGTLAFERPYADGRLDGVVREWFPDGSRYREATYAAGHESGSQRMWWEDGTVRAAYVVRDGRRWGRIGSKGCVGDAEEAS